MFVEIVHVCQLDTLRGLAHPNRRYGWLWPEVRAAYEHQLHVANKCAGREAPAPDGRARPSELLQNAASGGVRKRGKQGLETGTHILSQEVGDVGHALQ